jgi:hypothetical protein
MRNSYFAKRTGNDDEEVLIWKVVKYIWKEVLPYHKGNGSEAGWGEKVYSQVLDIPLQPTEGLNWRNITNCAYRTQKSSPF